MPRLFPPRTPRVLELRIHGIKNTPPAVMLGVAPDTIHRATGDDLGGFYIENDGAGHRGIRREAYSWGALARAGGGPIALFGQLVVHIGWLLILPFGLVNVAYWTRQIPRQKVAGAWTGGVGTATLRLFALGLTLFSVTAMASVALDLVGVQCYRAGFVCSQLPGIFDALPTNNRALRLAILALLPLAAILLMFVISFRARVKYEPTITEGITRSGYAGQPVSPGPLLSSAEFWVHARVAAASEWLHVSGTLLLLSLLLSLDAIGVAAPECATRDRFVTSGCARLDGPLAAAAPLVVCCAIPLIGLGLVAWRIFVGSETKSSRSVLQRRRMIAGLVLTSSVIDFITTGIVTSLFSSGDPASGAASLDHLPVPIATTGLEATPTVLITLLLAMGISGIGWRRGVPMWLSSVVLGGALVALAVWRAWGGSLVASISVGSAGAEWWAIIAGALVAIHLLLVALWPRLSGRARSRYVGWRGAGPGVVMLLALGVGMTLSSLLVVGVAAWLVIPVSAARSTSSDVRALDQMWRDNGITLGSAQSQISVPPPYVEFGFALVVMIAAMVIVVVGVALGSVSRLRMLTTPALRIGGSPFAALYTYPSGRPPKVTTDAPLDLRILKARRIAALTQRGEPLLGILAVTIAIGLAFTVVAQFPRSGQLGDVADSLVPLQPALQWLLTAAPSLAIGSLSAIALSAVAAVAANALTTRERPVGLLWDLICFLPRAGHPFGPPCYADRVVPEVNTRIGQWLDPAGRPDPSRRVIVSAHSLGAVLAVAAIFARGAQTPEHLDRIGLLTYGTQLRNYFGRFFPELVGPSVLGTRPCRGPSLLLPDPWLRQVREDEEGSRSRSDVGADDVDVNSLVGMLTRRGDRVHPRGGTLGQPLAGTRGSPGVSTRGDDVTGGRVDDRSGILPAVGVGLAPLWIGLWRRTDFLGFPVDSYAARAGAIDQGAGEIEPTSYLVKIATHGGYPLVAQYHHAVETLVRRLR